MHCIVAQYNTAAGLTVDYAVMYCQAKSITYKLQQASALDAWVTLAALTWYDRIDMLRTDCSRETRRALHFLAHHAHEPESVPIIIIIVVFVVVVMLTVTVVVSGTVVGNVSAGCRANPGLHRKGSARSSVAATDGQTFTAQLVHCG